MDPRERSPPASRPPRHIIQAKRATNSNVVSSVRDLLKDKLKTKLKPEMDSKFKTEKDKSDMSKLEDALDSMHVSQTHKKTKYNGGWYHIHKGERGGKYIVVQGQKKYLPRASK